MTKLAASPDFIELDKIKILVFPHGQIATLTKFGS